MVRQQLGSVAFLFFIAASSILYAHGDGKGLLDGSGVDVPHPESFATENMNVIAHLPISMLGGNEPITDPNGWGQVIVNDIWGWTDAETGHEYALVGRSDATAFVDITIPESPVFLGLLPSNSQNYWWRDIKTYGDYAFIVADVSRHGLQVFDLSRLRGLTEAPAETWSADAVYRSFGNSHNVAINPDSGFLVATGTDTFQGGLHFVDINNPLEPQAAGGMRGIGYAHDAQAVTYHGPDADYAGAELVIAFTVDSLTVVDASEPADAQLVSRTQYPDSQYSHQGWLTEDHRFVLMDDELDEMYNGTKTRTHIWNVEDLDSPRYLGYHEFETSSIDHNLYIHDGRAYAANYLSGLRVLDLTDIENGNLAEVASLDTHPHTDDADFGGAWSVYPFFESGNIILSDMSEGLVVARLNLLNQTLVGDYNGNGTLDSGDLDLLSSAIRNAAELSDADLNKDGTLDRLDRTAWVHEIAQTVYGDADLNGRFDSSDLTAIFQAGEYEDTLPVNSTWATGDWNGDGEFDSSDLILALQDGGFQFDAKSVHAVPEPSKLNSVCWAMVIIGMVIRRRENRRN